MNFAHPLEVHKLLGAHMPILLDSFNQSFVQGVF